MRSIVYIILIVLIIGTVMAINKYSQLERSFEETEERIDNGNLVVNDFEGEVDPITVVKGVLARASKENNEEKSLGPSEISNELEVSEVLKTEGAWEAAKNDFKGLFLMTQQESERFWSEIKNIQNVGGWIFYVEENLLK